jgi:hypothetical protein
MLTVNFPIGTDTNLGIEKVQPAIKSRLMAIKDTYWQSTIVGNSVNCSVLARVIRHARKAVLP